MLVHPEGQLFQTLSPDFVTCNISIFMQISNANMCAQKLFWYFNTIAVTCKDERLVTRLLIRHYVILCWGHQSSFYNLLPWGRNGMWQTKWKAMTFLSNYCSSHINLWSKDMTNYTHFFPINISYAQWNNSFYISISCGIIEKDLLKCIIHDLFTHKHITGNSNP